jgi:chromosome partitioning protein
MILSIANQKGGVAKTTTAINIAAGLANEGYKVLLIDADPQTNASQVFIHPDMEITLDKTLYTSLINFTPIPHIIRETRFPNVSIVPSHIRLSGIDLELAQAFDNRSARLKTVLEPIKKAYDYIIIDNPPALGLMTINSFVASDRLIIPVSTAFFALSGLVQLQETIGMIQQSQFNPDFEIMGVLCTFTDKTIVSRDVERELRVYFDKKVFDTVIPRNVALEEAHSNHTHIFDYSPTSAGAKAYKRLIKEIISR